MVKAINAERLELIHFDTHTALLLHCMAQGTAELPRTVNCSSLGYVLEG